MMALLSCPKCRKQRISELAEFCPKCGNKLPVRDAAEQPPSPEINPILKWLFIIGFIFYGISRFFLSPDSSDNHSIVYNSSLDGSVYQVKAWLKENLKDPSSLEFIEWSPVTKKNDGSFMVRVKYRAKNSFNGYVIENVIFFMDSTGLVSSTLPYGG